MRKDRILARLGRVSLVGFVIIGLFMAVSARAASITWGNVSTGADWGTGSNWSGGNVPGAGDIGLLYNTGTGSSNNLANPTVSGSYAVLGLDIHMENLTFGNGQALTINRGSGTSMLAIGSSGISTDQVLATVTINPDILVTANQSWNANTNATILLTGTLSNSGAVSITKLGSGNLNIYGNITNYTGNFIDSAGSLQFGGNSIYSGVISGAGGIYLQNSATLALKGANTYSGVTNIVTGVARVSTIGNGGVSSAPLGTNSKISFGANGATGTLEYTGAGESANRTIEIVGSGTSNAVGAAVINNLGAGTLTLAGNVTTASISSSGTDMLQTGGNIVITGTIADNANGGKVSLKAFGGIGTTTLQSASTFTGGLNINNNGTLVVDYTNGATVASGNSVNFNSGGTLNLSALAASPKTQTLGNLAFVDGMNHVVLNNTALTLGTLTRNTNIAQAILFDLSNSGSLTASTTGGSGSLVDNVIVGGSTSTNFAGFIVRTGTGGYDFASATSSGAAQNIIALGANGNASAFSTFTGSNGSGNTVNGRISSNGTTTIGSTAQTLGTLRVDTTSAAGGTLAVGSGGLTIAKNGLLFDGTGNYTVSGAGNLAAIGVYQYSTGTVTISSGFNVSVRLDKFGPGLLVNNSSTIMNSGAGTSALSLNVMEGLYRAGTAGALSGGRISMGGGAILELTAGSGDLTRAIGTSGSNLQLIADAGFSTFGSNRAVLLGGTSSPTSLVWNSTGSFLGSGNKLILSSTTSDSTIDFRNNIDFNGVQRQISVNDGSASVDAILSGTLTSNSFAGGGFYKSGAGTLAITGSNIYTGDTTIAAGQLNIGYIGTTGTSTGAGAVTYNGTSGSLAGNVVNNALLAFNRSDSYTYAGSISGTGVVKQIGSGSTLLSGSNSYSGGTTISAGTLKLGNGSALGSTSGALTLNGATLDLNGFSATVGATTLSSGTINATSAGTLTTGGLVANGAGNTIGANATVGGGATVNSAAALTVSGTINGGAIVSNGGSLSVNGGLNGGATVNSGGTLSVAGSLIGGATINGGMSGSGTVGGAVLVGGTISGSLTFNGNVTLNSGATAAAGAFNGDLTVNSGGTASASAFNGNVAANGAITGDLSLQSGKTLSGLGSVTGGVTASAGSTVSPSANNTSALGNLTLGSFNEAASAHLALQINSTTAGDTITTTAPNGLSLAGDATFTFANSYSPTSDYIVLILNNGNGGVQGTFSGLTIVDVNGSTPYSGDAGTLVYVNGTQYALSYTASLDSSLGNDVALLAVPEPQTWAMLVGGLGLLIRIQSLRNRRSGAR